MHICIYVAGKTKRNEEIHTVDLDDREGVAVLGKRDETARMVEGKHVQRGGRQPKVTVMAREIYLFLDVALELVFIGVLAGDDLGSDCLDIGRDVVSWVIVATRGVFEVIDIALPLKVGLESVDDGQSSRLIERHGSNALVRERGGNGWVKPCTDGEGGLVRAETPRC